MFPYVGILLMKERGWWEQEWDWYIMNVKQKSVMEFRLLAPIHFILQIVFFQNAMPVPSRGAGKRGAQKKKRRTERKKRIKLQRDIDFVCTYIYVSKSNALVSYIHAGYKKDISFFFAHIFI